jgi:septum formation protein
MELLDKLAQYKIILVSKSPRRQYLLKEMGLNFEIANRSDISEEYPADLTCDEIPVYLARLKAQSFTDIINSNTIIIAADTIVCLNNQILGKPVDYNDAVRILKLLSGDKHKVLTGICIKSPEKETTFCAKSEVYFNSLSDSEISYYIEKYKPYDKAGSYGIQEWIGYIGIERIEGSYFNVMGLPTHKLYNELSKFINNDF